MSGVSVRHDHGLVESDADLVCTPGSSAAPSKIGTSMEDLLVILI